MGLITSPYNDDITIHCKVRHSRQGQDRFGATTDMLLTLRNWHYDENTTLSSHELLFVGGESSSHYYQKQHNHQDPELLLRPLPSFPSKFRNRSILPICSLQDYKIAGRISLTDIYKATMLVGTRVLLLELPQAVSLELDCLTQNAADLVGAALQSRLPPTRWNRHSVPEHNTTLASCDDTSPCPPTANNEYDVDTLTAACMRATAAQESLGDKLQRRWGKAVNDLTQIMEGQAA